MKNSFFLFFLFLAAVTVSSTPIRQHELPETYYEASLNVSRIKINLIGANMTELKDKSINSIIADAHSAEIMIEKEGENAVLVVTLDYRNCIIEGLGVLALLIIFVIYFILFIMALLHILKLFILKKHPQPILKKNECKARNNKCKSSIFIVGVGADV